MTVMQVYRGVEDVAKELGMSPSTVKKYYLLIEQHGYRFRRTQQGQVMFTDYDVQLFRKLIQLKNEPGMTLQKAVEKVMSLITDITVATDTTDMSDTKDIVDPTTMTVITEDLNQLKEILAKQHELLQIQQQQINKLIQEQEKNQKRLESGVSERDKLLMQSIRETQETKRLLLEVKEQIAAAQEKKWWKFWK
jgi:DNA-binding transcriptional MerR regulator